MEKELKKCYEKEYCCFCQKKNCDKRIQDYGDKDNFECECDGNCFECEKALRRVSLPSLFDLKLIGIELHCCVMYQFMKNKYIDFYGMEGKEQDYSKIELAVMQLQKCEKCQNEKVYYNLLKQIIQKIEEVPRCFESMTNLTSNRALELANYSIADVLQNNYTCKIKIEIARMIKEYLNSNEDKLLDLNKLCEYINSKSKNIDYYIHPLTVKVILMEMKDCECGNKK